MIILCFLKHILRYCIFFLLQEFLIKGMFGNPYLCSSVWYIPTLTCLPCWLCLIRILLDTHFHQFDSVFLDLSITFKILIIFSPSTSILCDSCFGVLKYSAFSFHGFYKIFDIYYYKYSSQLLFSSGKIRISTDYIL